MRMVGGRFRVVRPRRCRPAIRLCPSQTFICSSTDCSERDEVHLGPRDRQVGRFLQGPKAPNCAKMSKFGYSLPLFRLEAYIDLVPRLHEIIMLPEEATAYPCTITTESNFKVKHLKKGSML